MQTKKVYKEYDLILWEENKSGNFIVAWITENCLHSIYLQANTDFMDFHRIVTGVDVSSAEARSYVDDVQGRLCISEEDSCELSMFSSQDKKQFTSLFVGRLDTVFEVNDCGEALFSEDEKFPEYEGFLPDNVDTIHKNKYWYRFHDDVANVYGGPYKRLFAAIQGLYNKLHP